MMERALVTIEWVVLEGSRLVRVDVDADEAGNPVAVRAVDSDRSYPLAEFRRQIEGHEGSFRRAAARCHRRLREIAGVREH